MTDEEPQLRYVVERCRTVLAEPDPTKVICPNCTHQFTAISVADQERLRAQSNAEPVVWPDIDAAVKAGLAWRNPAPDAAPSAHSNAKTVTIGNTARPCPDVSAEPVAWEYKTTKGWQRISLKNYKILKGSSFELRPIFDAKVGRRSTRSRT